jgi:glycyl-tRNA synthetase beta chain
MGKFLLEIGTEEMPARFLPGLILNAKELFQNIFKEKDIDFDRVESFATPRRIVVTIFEVPEFQNKRVKKIVGPPISIAKDENGNYTKAAIGFAKSQGVDVDQLFEEETPKGKYIAAKKEIGGAKVIDILPEICVDVISKLHFPKRMKWEDTGFLFGRPIRWILALLDKNIVKFEIASIKSGNLTYGHRVMGAGPFEISSCDEYFETIKTKGKVIIDPKLRLSIIKEIGEKEADKIGGKVIWDDELLDEVVNLVEYPLPLLGKFEEKFLQLPKEVLLTCIKTHQKSFGIEDSSGSLLPYFLCTLNIEPKDISLVKKGWERVLRARLEDAAFFWKVDNNAKLEDWREELNRVVFLGPLGSMGDKANRLEKICEYLSELLIPSLKKHLTRAAQLAKVDLVSEMVGEFDDLQGIMGGIYARRKGEDEVVCDAIYEHYLPTGVDSSLPKTIGGAILSMADKMDNIIGCFGLNMIPTGAQDPHGMRRQTLGIIRIILDKKFKFSLFDAFSKVWDIYGDINWKNTKDDVLNLLNEFVSGRLKGLFLSQGYPTKIVDAVIGAGIDCVYLTKKRLDGLFDFSKEKDFERAVLTFKRADNIIRKQGMAVEGGLSDKFDIEKMVEEEEKRLAQAVLDLNEKWNKLYEKEDFKSLFMMLTDLRPVVDEFFDKVMVMCEDIELRRNRLSLLYSLTKKLSSLADFSALQI